MNLIAFTPENELEHAIVSAKEGRCSIAQLLDIAVHSNLFLPSRSEVQQDGGGFQPLLLEQNDQPMMAVFSCLSRPHAPTAEAKYLLQMNGKEFFLRIPPGYGLILNPGYEAQLLMSPERTAEFQKELKRTG